MNITIQNKCRHLGIVVEAKERHQITRLNRGIHYTWCRDANGTIDGDRRDEGEASVDGVETPVVVEVRRQIEHQRGGGQVVLRPEGLEHAAVFLAREGEAHLSTRLLHHRLARDGESDGVSVLEGGGIYSE